MEPHSLIRDIFRRQRRGVALTAGFRQSTRSAAAAPLPPGLLLFTFNDVQSAGPALLAGRSRQARSGDRIAVVSPGWIVEVGTPGGAYASAWHR
jgi:hypothetical protein